MKAGKKLEELRKRFHDNAKLLAKGEKVKNTSPALRNLARNYAV